MTRHRNEVYTTAKTPRFCVIFDLQWQVIESMKLEARTDLPAAMAAEIEKQVSLGWQTESSHEFGFVFLRRAGERRLLILTERDPYDRRPQSFSPFSQCCAPRT
ncbi:MAG TPA: hypothetical protein VGN99_02875 [Steroidobacteraceae bacterium]|nr:hypothetical protein [Steroidobacteraceae bacterium]